MSEDRPELVPLDAPTLVEASAGTGKTYTITTYFVRALLELGLEPEQILVLTYTKAATAELRSRSRERIVNALELLEGPPEKPDALHELVTNAAEKLGRAEVEQKLRGALGKMDQAPILTIHGFCQRLLQEHPLLFGIDFEFEVTADDAALRNELAVDFWTSELYDKPEWFLRALKEGKVSPDRLAAMAKLAAMPSGEILGPEPCPLDERRVQSYLARKREAGLIWSAESDAIYELVVGHAGLHGGTYKAPTIRDKWVPALDAYFADERFTYPPEPVAKLAQGRMRVKKGQDEPTHGFFGACAALEDAREDLRPMLESAVFDFKMRFLEYAREASQRRRVDTAVMTYDDLLTMVYAPLDGSNDEVSESRRDAIIAAVSGAYPLALVDEFQDTDAVQYGIFRAVYGAGAAVYVGDPKQAIYSFRGADVFSYIEAASDVGSRRHTLRTNWRSDSGVVQAVNELFSARDRPFVIEEIGFTPALAHHEEARTSLGPPMEFVFLDEETLKGTLAEAVAPILANEIALLLESDAKVDGRPVQADDLAVLCRSNIQAIAVTNALRAMNVPASLDGGSSVLETELAEDLRAVLEAALAPGDLRAIRRALLTTLLGVSPYELSSMDDETWSEWVARFNQWNQLWHRYGVLRFLEEMLRSAQGEVRIASQPEPRRGLADLQHLEELLLRAEREHRSNPVALMQWFRRLSEGSGDAGGVAREDLQRRPDAQSGAVRISTIHKSKGLEYGIVYCPFPWEKSQPSADGALRFHDAERQMKLDFGSAALEEHKDLTKQEELSDALRLLYVAATRAKHQCILFWGRATGWKRAGLRYLLHGDEGFDKLKEDAMRDAVEALAAKSSGSIGCRSPHEEVAAPWIEEAPNEKLRAAVPVRSFSHAPRIASFTSLTGHDEKMPVARAEQLESPADPAPALFEELVGGARTGLLLHSILEHADFALLGAEESRELIRRELAASGFDGELREEVQRDLELVVSTPLMMGSDAPSLRDLSRDRQLRELEFTLSADHPNLDALAELLKRYEAPAGAPGYHERLGVLSSQNLQKYLRGFIDLVFEWNGRWYVADYKSNSLPSYGTAAVSEAVQREHYLLQAQLYTAAAHRYLGGRLSDYDPEQHWGGAMFLFLRGMRGADAGSESIFFDRQPAELLQAVDEWLGGPR